MEFVVRSTLPFNCTARLRRRQWYEYRDKKQIKASLTSCQLPVRGEYNISTFHIATIARFLECDEDVDVETDGVANLVQHTGKSNCEKAKERKKKLKKKGKIRTLVDVGMTRKRAKDTTYSTTTSPA